MPYNSVWNPKGDKLGKNKFWTESQAVDKDPQDDTEITNSLPYNPIWNPFGDRNHDEAVGTDD